MMKILVITDILTNILTQNIGLKLMKIMKILRKILKKNYIRSKNKHFIGFFLKKMIYIYIYNLHQ